MKLWCATVVDSGDTCDGRARTIGLFKSEASARAAVAEDIRQYAERIGAVPDFGEMCVVDEDADAVSLWNVEETEVED